MVSVDLVDVPRVVQRRSSLAFVCTALPSDVRHARRSAAAVGAVGFVGGMVFGGGGGAQPACGISCLEGGGGGGGVLEAGGVLGGAGAAIH